MKAIQASQSISLIVSVIVFLTPQITQAQRITYLSNLGQTSTGSLAIGSDSWLAADIITGNNASGYLLNSIQLAMTDASGNPNGFTVAIYSSVIGSAIHPGSSLGTLNGSLSPVTSGIYIYNVALKSDTVPRYRLFYCVDCCNYDCQWVL